MSVFNTAFGDVFLEVFDGYVNTSGCLIGQNIVPSGQTIIGFFRRI